MEFQLMKRILERLQNSGFEPNMSREEWSKAIDGAFKDIYANNILFGKGVSVTEFETLVTQMLILQKRQ